MQLHACPPAIALAKRQLSFKKLEEETTSSDNVVDIWKYAPEVKEMLGKLLFGNERQTIKRQQ